MKTLKTAVRAAAAVFAAALALCASSCVESAEEEIKAVFPVTAGCTLFPGGEPLPFDVRFVAEISEPGRARIAFTGGELAGAVISVCPDGAFFSQDGGADIPLAADEGAPIFAVVRAFSAGEEDLTSVSREKDGGAKATAGLGEGVLEISYSGGSPELIRYTGPRGGYTVRVDGSERPAE